jgi:formylglycine-generating enzyme required for sulfatase activity
MIAAAEVDPHLRLFQCALGVYEVTRAQFRAFVNDTSYIQDGLHLNERAR